MTSWYLVPPSNSTCWTCVLCLKNCVWRNCLQNVRCVSLGSSRLSTWGILLKLVVCARTLIRLKPYVPGRNQPQWKYCSNSLALLITTHSTSSITPIVLLRWQTWPVLSDRGIGVLRKMQHLQSCVNYCATRLYWNYLILRGCLWLILMHVRMQLVQCCCRHMMMVCTPLHTIVASMLRRERNYGGGEKELLVIY